MPGTKQQRKTVVVSKAKTTQQAPSSDISSFTRVSKTVVANTKKELIPSTPKKNVKIEVLIPSSRKRKAAVAVEDDSSDEKTPKKLATSFAAKVASPSTTSASAQPVRRGRDRSKKLRPEPTPKKRLRSPSVTDSDISTIDTKSLFKKLRLDSSPSRCSSPNTADTSIAGSDIELDTNRTKPGELPEEVLSLISLHNAFLRALTLHYTHNGSNVPLDLRSLCPDVARAWGKKRVTSADIRTCLGVLGRTSSPSSQNDNPLTLSNYGRNKICVEIDQSCRFGSLNENKLNALFRTNINALWAEFIGGGKTDAKAFLATLPKAAVTLCESVVKASPLQLKGQKRLEDLKQGIAAKKQEQEAAAQSKSSTTTTDTPPTMMMNADGTKMSLLDRIRLKSLQKAALSAAGLSPAQLERRAALHRVEEVSALIAMLSRASSEGGAGGRISFTMAALLEKLKDSFRMGISKQEGAVCVRLLAAEVAPEWVRVVTLSGRENVVVEVACQVGKPEVARRVQGILGKE